MATIYTVDWPPQPGPIRPLRGHAPRKYSRLQHMPRVITEAHLMAAYRVLQMGSVGLLMMNQDLDFRPHAERQRRAYVQLAVYQQWQHFAPEKLLKVLQKEAKLADHSKRGNQLYRWNYRVFDVHHRREEDMTFHYLAYRCPSTGKLYLSGVPDLRWPKRAADHAMAWKYGLTLKEYDQLKTES